MGPSVMGPWLRRCIGWTPLRSGRTHGRKERDNLCLETSNTRNTRNPSTQKETFRGEFPQSERQRKRLSALAAPHPSKGLFPCLSPPKSHWRTRRHFASLYHAHHDNVIAVKDQDTLVLVLKCIETQVFCPVIGDVDLVSFVWNRELKRPPLAHT